jgi:hypothetical protein
MPKLLNNSDQSRTFYEVQVIECCLLIHDFIYCCLLARWINEENLDRSVQFVQTKFYEYGISFDFEIFLIYFLYS